MLRPRFPGCLAVVAGLSLVAGPVRGLDFRLHATTVQEDGQPREQLSFRADAGTEVAIALPGGWARADDVGSLTLTPPRITNGMVRIERSALTPAVAFRDAGLDTYRQRVLAGIPQGAAEIKASGDADDPLPIFGWKSHEWTVDYDFFGQSYRRSVLFLNLNAREQLMLTTVSLRADFDPVHAAGLDVLRSWQVMPAP